MKVYLPVTVVLLLTFAAFCSADNLRQLTQHGKKIIYVLDLKKPVNGDDAKVLCEQKGMTLAALESSAENEAVKKYLKGRADGGKDFYHGWLGGSDIGSTGTWYWIYNKKTIGPYSNWDEFFPQSDGKYYHCVRMSPSGKWITTYCDILADGLPICHRKL